MNTMNTQLKIKQIKNKFFLNGRKASLDTIIAKMCEENVYLKTLHLANFGAGLPSAVIDALVHLDHNLGSLIMTNCVVWSNDVQSISNFVKALNLSKIKISYNSMAFSTIIEATAQSFLRELILDSVRIEEGTAMNIIAFLKKQSLVKLSFFGCEFENDTFILIMDAIKKSTLKILILNLVTLHDDRIIAFTDCVINSKLTKLSIHNLSASINNFNFIVETIKASSLKTLDARYMLKFKEFNTVKNLICNSNITKFKFSHAEFSPEEKMELIDLMQERHRLTNISFYETRFTDELLTKVCDLLENPHSRLTSLDLSRCKFTDAGLNKMIASIKSSSITSLNLSGYVQMRGPLYFDILIICDLLENHYLEKLKLCFVDCTNEIMNLMLPSIMKSSLIKFDIDRCTKVDERTRNEIGAMLRDRQHCRKIKSARSVMIK